jgi:hypothetical protein
MATTSTYKFTQDNTTHACYIHYDGYPKGAASYLYQMLIGTPRANLATRFLRANDSAELVVADRISSEYLYHITGDGPDARIDVHIRQWNNPDYVLHYSGPLWDFIDIHNELIEDYHKFMKVSLPYIEKYMNLITAKRELESHLDHLRLWDGKFNGHGNWNSCRDCAMRILEAFPELRTTENSELLHVSKMLVVAT